MATIFGSIGRLVHDTSSALIEKSVTTKLSDTVTSLIQSGFQVAEDVLVITKDLSAPDEEPEEGS